MNVKNSFIAWVIAACIPLSVAQAEEDQTELHRWIDRAWTQAQDFAMLRDGMWISCNVYNLDLPDPQEIEFLRNAVEGKPHHPGSQTLAQYELMIEGKPGSTLCVWQYGDMTRVNTDSYGSRHQYNDVATSDGVSWKLNPRGLSIYDQGCTQTPQGARPEYARHIALNELGMFLGRGFFPAARQRRDAPDVRVLADGKRWRATVGKVGSDEPEWTIEGVWNQEGGYGEAATAIRRTENDVARIEFHGWKYHSNIGASFPTAIVWDIDGEPFRRYELTGLGTIDEARMSELAALPEHDRPDPLRGELTFRSVQDERAQARTVARGGADPFLQGRSHGFDPTGDTAEQSGRSVRVYGWVGVAGLILAVIGVRVWKARSMQSAT